MRGLNVRIFLIVVLAFALSAEILAASPPLRLGDIRAQLYYSWTGKLSDNVLRGNQPYSGWNTCIEDGAPNDVLVSVPVIVAVRPGQDGQISTTIPVSLIARSGSKILAQRTVSHVFTSKQGNAYVALWLRDVTCGVGTVTIEARMGNQRKAASLEFDGGE